MSTGRTLAALDHAPTAAEADAFARGRVEGYAAGYRDGARGATVAAEVEAAAFAELARRIFRDPLPFAELQARRDGPDSTSARRAREVAEELAAAVAADVAAERQALATTATPRRAA